MELNQIEKELFGSQTNFYCKVCGMEGLVRLFVAMDKYEQASAPVIVSAGQTAEVKIGRNTKAANKRKRD